MGGTEDSHLSNQNFYCFSQTLYPVKTPPPFGQLSPGQPFFTQGQGYSGVGETGLAPDLPATSCGSRSKPPGNISPP